MVRGPQHRQPRWASCSASPDQGLRARDRVKTVNSKTGERSAGQRARLIAIQYLSTRWSPPSVVEKEEGHHCERLGLENGERKQICSCDLGRSSPQN
jgi:hypothetical protein